MYHHRKPEWLIPEREATPESTFINRRKFLTGSAGIVGGGILGALGLPKIVKSKTRVPNDPTLELYPAKQNLAFMLDRPLTEESIANKYNNFYEFGGTKTIHWLSRRLEIRPWKVKIHGLVRKPRTYDIDTLIQSMPLEERLYRFRCVETWAMAVPWTGFPISKLIKAVEPESKAKYIKMTAFLNRKVALGQLQVWYPWPYVEGLTIAEGMNEMAMFATGVYGKPLPKQHGAPIRLIIPWKYGFKSIKSIVDIEFTDKRPVSFWEEVAPDEYGFWANVNPKVPHPRWSQASERMLGTNKRYPTKIFNGYEKWVTKLYSKGSNEKYFM